MNAYAQSLAGHAEFNFGSMSAAPLASREFFTGSGAPSGAPILQADLRVLEDLVDTLLAEKALSQGRPEDYISLDDLNRHFGR